MKHDPAKLAARHAAFSSRMDAATAEIDAKITVLQAERSRAIAAVIAEHTTFADGRIFAASARCRQCGAGLCYDERLAGVHGSWKCSTDPNHESFPFAFYEIKSEDQPSAMGQTTRAEPVDIL